MENNELSNVNAELVDLRQQLEALASENAALKGFVEERCWVYDDDVEGYRDAHNYLPETPATDAYLKAVREAAIREHIASDEFQIDLAVAWARVDGLDDRDLDTVIWEGQPPEPMGSVFDWEYLPRAGRVIEKLRTAGQADKDGSHA